MFKLIAEAYEVLSNPESRRNYDIYGHDGPRMTEDQENDSDDGYQRRTHRGGKGPRRATRSHSSFSDERAFDIFNQFFAQFEHDMHGFGGGWGIFSDPFFDKDPSLSTSQRDSTRHQAHSKKGTQQGKHDLFNDSFFSDFGMMGRGGLLGNSFLDMNTGGDGGMHKMTTFTSMSTSSSTGGRMVGTSTSTRTIIGPDGVKRVRKEVSVRRPDGTVDTSVEEYVDDKPLSLTGGGRGDKQAKVLTGGGSGKSKRDWGKLGNIGGW